MQEDFWAHARSHIKDDKLLQCPRCPFVTEYKHHLEYHLRNHFGSKPFKCGKCNYSCVNKSMLNSHMKSHTNVYQYRCADCTYATKYCHSLKLHLRKYNHKPATVLNSDGSLPQGIDAEASGLSLMQKRGPPRGPRVPRKDKFEPYLNHLLPMSHGGIPGMPPGLNGGMMSPYWPILNQFPNGLQGPPPLVPVNSHLGPHLPPDFMTKDFQRDPALSRIMSGALRGLSRGELPFKCNFCNFSTDSKQDLLPHVRKAHPAEYQDLFSTFGFSEPTLEERLIQNMAAHQARMAFSPHKRPASVENAPFQVKTEPEDDTKTSPHSWPHQPSPAKSRKLEDSSYMGYNMSRQGGYSPYSNGEVSPSPRKPTEIPEGGEDIIKQMMHKFGSGIPPAAPKSARESSPLDLTKPRSPDMFSPLAEAYQRHMELRMEDANDDNVSSGGENSTTDAQGQRKRSRKGKAFKLDTLCMKLQEKQGDNAYRSNEEDNFSDGEEYPSQQTTTEGQGQGQGHSGSEATSPHTNTSRPASANSETIAEQHRLEEFNTIRKNLDILNQKQMEEGDIDLQRSNRNSVDTTDSKGQDTSPEGQCNHFLIGSYLRLL